jgi:hypothetical protein
MQVSTILSTRPRIPSAFTSIATLSSWTTGTSSSSRNKSLSRYHIDDYNHHHGRFSFPVNTDNNATNMKFTTSTTATCLLLSHVSAWSAPSRPFRPHLVLHSALTRSYSTEVLGEYQTESFRLRFSEDNKAFSPWHDIPLTNGDGTYNMVSLCDGLFGCNMILLFIVDSHMTVFLPCYCYFLYTLFYMYIYILNIRSSKSPK